MDGMAIFVIVSTTLGITRALPQLMRILRTRQAHGVSVDTSATSALVSSGWAVYGLWTHQPSISFASSATAVIFVLITLTALRFGRHLKELKIAPVWLVVLVLFAGLGGAIGLSLVLLISGLVANIPQIRIAYKEGNLASLSLTTWLLAMAEGLLWGSYGIVQRDIAVFMNNGFLVGTSAMIVILKLTQMLRDAKQRETAICVIDE